ncbi:uncharacterized protein Ripalpha [Chelonus insularis]|uniref:uncharacterized protein Ripalpha n=1 Tax=Chelonus insularis TaxID=460826 RepID=UPI00158ABFAD|nr:uncharacterized protein LOC118073251 [Chelonus insularis]
MNNLHELTLKSPVRSPKLNRTALKKIQSSPQLKNILRQKWQQRLKEKRNTSFNWRRFGPHKEKDLIDESLTTEMYELMDETLSTDFGIEVDSDADWEDWFQKQCAEEEEQLMMLEYEDIQTFEGFIDSFIAASYGDSDFVEVICPMCQKNTMTEEDGKIGCSNCNFVLPAKMSLEDFSNSINSKSAMHSACCTSCPTFITTPENDTISLYLTCDICSCCLLIM